MMEVDVTIKGQQTAKTFEIMVKDMECHMLIGNHYKNISPNIALLARSAEGLGMACLQDLDSWADFEGIVESIQTALSSMPRSFFKSLSSGDAIRIQINAL